VTVIPETAAAAPRCVFFDLDDTLFDHRYCTRQALAGVRRGHRSFQQWTEDELATRHAAVLEELHLQVIAGAIRLDDARRERFRRLFLAAGEAVDEPTVEACAAAYKEDYIRAWRPVPGALALLEQIHRETAVGIISNNLLREQLGKIRHCGFDRFASVTVISEAAGVAKPDPRIFTIALEQAQCRAEETVMVGDAWRTDIAGALTAGIRPVWINWDGAPATDPRAGVTQFRALEPVAPLVEAILAPAAAGRRARSHPTR
jgi:HAD superfamily hydrolase (TIGR01509 family)